MRRPLVVLAALAACRTPESRPTIDSTNARDARTIPLHAPAKLVENSAATMSVTQPDIWYTINDSGNEPLLFALDTTGADRGVWRVMDAENVDWESASIGPCIAADSLPRVQAGSPRCVYIGDTGDNNGRYASRTIYRVVEPRARSAGSTDTISSVRLEYRYPDQPHDVEGMYVSADGAINLITKRALSDGHGRPRPALVFRLPADAWTRRGVVVADLVDSLPIVPTTVADEVTDAALSPDGRRLAVRTYRQVIIFATDAATGRVIKSVPPVTCDVSALHEQQGEGVAWYAGSTRLLLTSEGRGVPMFVVTCPLPRKR